MFAFEKHETIISKLQKRKYESIAKAFKDIESEQLESKKITIDFKQRKQVLGCRISFKSSPNWQSISIVQLLWIIFLLHANKALSFDLKANFRYCSMNTVESMRINSSACKQTAAADTEYYTLYEKLDLVMHGMSKVCMKHRQRITTYKTFLGYSIITRHKIEPIRLSQYDCRRLIATNKCNQHKMTCSGDTCEHTEDPDYTTSWLTTLHFESFNCLVRQVHISSKSLSQPVFALAQSPCMPYDLYCIKDNSTYLWEMDIIEKCTYRKIETFEFNKTGQKLFNRNIDIQIGSSFEACNTVFFSTNYAELFIAKSDRQEYLSQTNEVTKSPRPTEPDNTVRQARSPIQKEICKSLMDFSTVVQLTDQVLVYLPYGDHMSMFVLINGDTEVLVPSCFDVDQIQNDFDLQNVECHQKIPVIFSHLDRTYSAYLQPYATISMPDHKTEFVCSKNSRLLFADKDQIDFEITGRDSAYSSVDHAFTEHTLTDGLAINNLDSSESLLIINTDYDDTTIFLTNEVAQVETSRGVNTVAIYASNVALPEYKTTPASESVSNTTPFSKKDLTVVSASHRANDSEDKMSSTSFIQKTKDYPLPDETMTMASSSDLLDPIETQYDSLQSVLSSTGFDVKPIETTHQLPIIFDNRLSAESSSTTMTTTQARSPESQLLAALTSTNPTTSLDEIDLKNSAWTHQTTKHDTTILPIQTDRIEPYNDQNESPDDDLGIQIIETQIKPEKSLFNLFKNSDPVPSEDKVNNVKIWLYVIMVINACTTLVVLVVVLVAMVAFVRYGCAIIYKIVTSWCGSKPELSTAEEISSLKTANYETIRPPGNNMPVIYENDEIVMNTDQRKRKIYFYDV